MIDPTHTTVSISRQCALLSISRSTFYYKSCRVNVQDLELMRIMDEQYLKTPFYGSRSFRLHLRKLGYKTNRKRVQRLMRLMGLEAIYPKPKTSKAHPQHKIYPYLLRGLTIDQPNQVWATDITYIPMRRGSMYLVAVMDWYSRKVLSWRVSNTLDSDFCIAAVKEAISKYGPPQIFNTDQGAQFTSHAFIGLLESNGIQVSMDGRGRCMDNIFIERLWWTVKYQYLYLRAFEDAVELRKGLRNWFGFYNEQRPHQTFDGLSPDDVYFKEQRFSKAA
jgi:putative transposase